MELCGIVLAHFTEILMEKLIFEQISLWFRLGPLELCIALSARLWERATPASSKRDVS